MLFSSRRRLRSSTARRLHGLLQKVRSLSSFLYHQAFIFPILRSTESEEKEFLVERAQNAARRVTTIAARTAAKASRGGKGGMRGGRGGSKAGGRKENKGSPKKSNTKSESNGQAETGGKRKRAVEPDGGPDAGVRGVGVPVIQSSKKPKTDEAPATLPEPTAAAS